MKGISIFLAALAPAFSVSAQKNNIELALCGYKFFSVVQQLNAPFNMLKIKYSRYITPNNSLFVQYSHAPLNGWLSAEVNSGLAKESLGKLTSHNQYNYYDLGIQHDFIKHARHTLAGFLGISVANGTDQYLSAILWTEPTSSEPNGHPFHAEYDDRSGVYGGFISGVRYDFSFAKSRLKIGPSFWVRYYTNSFPFQINYGVSMGYNF